MKRKRCGTCDGCRQVQDCGICLFCKDKPKFGQGKRKQYCVLKVCSFIANKTIPPGYVPLEKVQHSQPAKKIKQLRLSYKLVVINYIQ